MNYLKLVKFTVITSCFPSLWLALFPGKIVFISAILYAPIFIYILLIYKKIIFNKNVDGKIFLFFYFLFNLIFVIHGLFVVGSVKDFGIVLINGVFFAFIVPFIIFFGAINKSLICSLRIFFIYAIPLSLVLFFAVYDNGPLSFVKSISFLFLLLLISPILGYRFFLFLLLLSSSIYLNNLDIRSGFINFVVVSFLAATFWLKSLNSIYSILKLLRYLFLLLPLIFLTLGNLGVFNIFTIGDFYSRQLNISLNPNGNTRDILVDSRTSIYNDVNNELVKKEAFIFGLGFMGATDTSLLYVESNDFTKAYKNGRVSTESGMLNYIQWGGLLGLFVYMSIFIRASFLGMYKSNNWLSFVVGVWISFKCFYSFIDDPISFSPASISIFIGIGFCFNKKLRAMNNIDVSMMINNVFRKK